MYISKSWELKEALELIRNLQPQTRQFNYHLCLGGGVLNKGQSEKDLDLFFLPMGKDQKGKELVEWLTKLWGKGVEFKGKPKVNAWGEPVILRYEDFHDAFGNLIEKCVYDYPDEDDHLSYKAKFMYGDLRIDVFVVGNEKLKCEETKKVEEKKGWDVEIPFEEVQIPMPPPPQPVGQHQRGVFARAINDLLAAPNPWVGYRRG